MIYVLDACAMIAFLDGEPGSEVVEQAFLEVGSQCLAHAMNLSEVFYVPHRSGGESKAEQAIKDLIAIGAIERSDFDGLFWRALARLKAVHRRVSLADCCAIALTNLVGGVLLTSDHHELDSLAGQNVCPIQFIR